MPITIDGRTGQGKPGMFPNRRVPGQANAGVLFRGRDEVAPGGRIGNPANVSLLPPTLTSTGMVFFVTEGGGSRQLSILRANRAGRRGTRSGQRLRHNL
jgi:hypothetical protein